MEKHTVDHESALASDRPESTSNGHSSPADLILNGIQDSIETKEKLARECVEDIIAVAETIANALRDRRKVVLFGNGGSAADAQHIAAEFVGKFAATRPPLRALALTTNTSVLSAVGNDLGFDEVFSRQVTAHIDPGDVVVGISTSGRSKNVANGVREARRLGAKTVALTGSSGRALADLCDYRIMVPSANTQRIQECHILVGHILCGLVEANLTERGQSPSTLNDQRVAVGLRHEASKRSRTDRKLPEQHLFG